MASLENFHLANQAVSALSNVRRDIRSECTALKARLDAGEWTAAYVRTLANAQGNALLNNVLQKIADKQTEVEAALLEWSVSIEDTRADFMLLREAAVALRDATAGNVSATLTQILNLVPAKNRLW